MSSTQRKFYMIRMKGGEWEPRRKHTSLAKAMAVAFEMAEHHRRPATVLQTLTTVQVVDGKPKWIDSTPER